MSYKINQIAGDASFRKFYRIVLNKKSKIIIFAQKEKYKNLIAYSAINQFLRNNKILAPKLYSHNYSKGIILIEDFGDNLFHKILTKQKNKLLIYKKLVDLLLKIQKITPQNKIKNIDNSTHLIEKYSKKHLHKESDLFFKWYLPLIISKRRVLSVKKKMKKVLTKIYKKINFPNLHFVHRDYHCENLISVNNKIGVIDSQDALIGNAAYDLVSLIDDVRIKTSKNLKERIYNYYLKKASLKYRNNPKKFLTDFNILSVQRSLKIIGIFSRLYKRDKKKKYLKLIPYTWQLLEDRLNSDIFVELKQLLDKNISAKKRKKILFK